MMGEYGLKNEGEYVSSKLWVWKCNKSYVENSTKLKSDHVIYSLLKEEKKYLLTECSQMRKHTHKHKKRIHIAPKHSSYVYIITRVVQFMCTYFCRHTYTFMFTRVQQLLGRINSQPSEKRNGWTECSSFFLSKNSQIPCESFLMKVLVVMSVDCGLLCKGLQESRGQKFKVNHSM